MVFVVNHWLKNGSKEKSLHKQATPQCKQHLKAGEKNTTWLFEAWLSSGQKKVCLKGDDADHFTGTRKALAKEAGLLTSKSTRCRTYSNPFRFLDRIGNRALSRRFSRENHRNISNFFEIRRMGWTIFQFHHC